MSVEYFLGEGGRRRGPFSLQKLALERLTADTLVWRQPMTSWAKAGTLPELQHLFLQVPPPLPVEFTSGIKTPPFPAVSAAKGRQPADPAPPGRKPGPSESPTRNAARPAQAPVTPVSERSTSPGAHGRTGSQPERTPSRRTARPKEPNGLVVIWIFTAAVAGLISLGVLPVSCGKTLPYFGRHYQQYCDACDGQGKVKQSCPKCAGHGYYAGVRCATCAGSGKVDRICPYCGGSGHKPKKE